MTLGQLIKDLRTKIGMTQEELAEKTDISVRTIQRIENGDVDPRSYTLQKIASALSIDYEELIKAGSDDLEKENSSKSKVWLSILHLSGLFTLLFPPIIIWLWKKDKIKNIREHAIDVINFQISILIYIMLSSILIFIGLPIALLWGIFSTVVILINTIKVRNSQSYKYPLTIKILKP
jgi:uncharacterized Tic20 family protein